MQLAQLLQTDNVIIVSASYILFSMNYQNYESYNHEKSIFQVYVCTKMHH